jgi:magnesium transporter
MEPTTELADQAHLSERILEALQTEEATQLLREIRPPDLAEALSTIAPQDAAKILQHISLELAVSVIDEHAFANRSLVLGLLDLDLATALVDAMSPDERADLFSQLTSELAEVLRPRLSKEAAQNLSSLLRYHPESAGGIMTTEFVSIRDHVTVGDAIESIRAVANQKETIYYTYITESATGILLGIVSLRELLANHPLELVKDIMMTEPKTVYADTDQEEVARLLSRYDLLAIPVINARRQVVGIVTVDDVLDVLIEEQGEDLQKLGGMDAIENSYMQTSFFDLLKKRGGWLAILLFGEMLTATAMSHFEHDLSRAIVLSLFLPLIISSGGNSGSQATTLIIRALSVGEMALSDWWKVVRREFATGLALGLLLAVMGFVRVVLWHLAGFQDYGPFYYLIGATVGLSLIGVVLLGTMAGSMLPFALKRLKLDPASASAPLVATLVDVSGVVIYFMIASVVLRGSLL